ncbi:hypothetical protein ACQCX2_07400 [Propionibacteriaceae bacterium Y1700]|uniref:hypothetical protein n=1 Tax=Microlunatus sp. Y1700 TaxID=3418487 RepID=UPI003DA6D26E
MKGESEIRVSGSAADHEAGPDVEGQSRECHQHRVRVAGPSYAEHRPDHQQHRPHQRQPEEHEPGLALEQHDAGQQDTGHHKMQHHQQRPHDGPPPPRHALSGRWAQMNTRKEHRLSDTASPTSATVGDSAALISRHSNVITMTARDTAVVTRSPAGSPTSRGLPRRTGSRTAPRSTCAVTARQSKAAERGTDMTSP